MWRITAVRGEFLLRPTSSDTPCVFSFHLKLLIMNVGAVA